MSSKELVSLHIPTNGLWDFGLVHVLVNTWYCQSFNFRHSRDIECYLIVVLISTHLQLMRMSIFHVLIDISCIFFGKGSLWIFWSFETWSSLIIESYFSFYILDTNPLSYIHIVNIFSHSGCSFSFFKWWLLKRRSF